MCILIYYRIPRYFVPLKCTSKIPKGYRIPRKIGQWTYQNEGAPEFECTTKTPSDTVVRLTLDTILPLTTLLSTMPRRKVFSNREKLHLLSQIDERQRSGETLRACCRHFNLQPSQVRRWRNMRGAISNPVAANRGSLHIGRGSILSSLQEELMRWFF